MTTILCATLTALLGYTIGKRVQVYKNNRRRRNFSRLHTPSPRSYNPFRHGC